MSVHTYVHPNCVPESFDLKRARSWTPLSETEETNARGRGNHKRMLRERDISGLCTDIRALYDLPPPVHAH